MTPITNKKNRSIQKNRTVKRVIRKLNYENYKLKIQIQSLKKELFESGPKHLNYENASEIAHEINNPINLVSNSISNLEVNVQYIIKLTNLYHELKNDKSGTTLKDVIRFEEETNIKLTVKELKKSVDRIRKGISRVHEISENLAFMGKSGRKLRLKTDINENIRNTLTLIDGLFNENIKLRTQFSDIPILKTVRGKLNQVFTNLIENAIEAIQEKPLIKNEYLSITTRTDNNYIVVEIEDSGIGMTPETKERLFEKFYTTKIPEKGTGLGMSISKQIIEEHHGFIEVESKFGEGTKITIKLPIKQP